MPLSDYADRCAQAAAIRHLITSQLLVVVDERMDKIEEMKHVPRSTIPRIRTKNYGNEWRAMDTLTIELNFTPRLKTRGVLR
jgi:hypothetical protein